MQCTRGIRSAFARTGQPQLDTSQIITPPIVVLPLRSGETVLSPLVAKGDRVFAGQRIAEDLHAGVSPLHASVSGTVVAVEARPQRTGGDAPAIVIESREGSRPAAQAQEVEAREDRDIWEAVFAAGIQECDPYRWPLAYRVVKPDLVPPGAWPEGEVPPPIGVLLLNGMDRQPGAHLRGSVLESEGIALLESIALLRRLSGAARIVLAVYADAVLNTQLEQGLKAARVEIVRCPAVYPLALEPVLVRQVLGLELARPAFDARAAGVALVDVLTAVRMQAAVATGGMLTHATAQVCVPSRNIDLRLEFPRGTLVTDILSHLGLEEEAFAKIVLGGAFLGVALQQSNVPLDGDADVILFQTAAEVARNTDEPCINCGYCVRSCPMRLLPNELSKLCEYGKFELAAEKDLFSCIECGICAYVCPAGRPMVHLLRFGKREFDLARRNA